MATDYIRLFITTGRKFLQVMLLLFVIVGGISLEWTGASTKAECPKNEMEALLAFEHDMIDVHGSLSSWAKEHGDCCLWKGVRCSNQTGHPHVTLLDLSFFQRWVLGGNISTLFELRELEYLDLSDNEFLHTPFPSFSNSSFPFPKLTHLSLSGPGIISSTFLHQLGNLSNLQFLHLGQSYYDLNNLDWLRHLSSLRYLDLSLTNLSEATDWLQVTNNLPHLQNLILSNCNLPSYSSFFSNASKSLATIDLSGNLLSTPFLYAWLCNMSSNLVGLSLSNIGLNGSVPNLFSSLVSLKHLDLSNNSFRGLIPESFDSMCNLQTLDLSKNELNGLVPEIRGCAKNSLEILRLSNNQLHGSLPDVTELSSLKELYLQSNRLNGSFPKVFGQPSKLSMLDLSENELKGSLPDLSMLLSLKKLVIDQNRLSGTIPESLGCLSELHTLNAAYNSFDGAMSEAHFRSLSKLVYLDLSFNSLALNVSSDWIPPFQLDYIGLSSCKLGPDFPKWLYTQNESSWLDISEAKIDDVIPDWFWDSISAVEYLNLSHNQMSGILPNLSSKSNKTRQLDLSSNRFQGPLPLFPTKVESLNLAGNTFSGTFSSICEIVGEHLIFLDLSNNLLSGELPDCFRPSCEVLSILSLANNGFSGGIPKSLGLLVSLKLLNLHNNSFSGVIPSALKNCSHLRFLDLSNNNLSGKIPVWIGESLTDLEFLSLQGNEFHGKIPIQICHLANIIIVDLCRNNLSGSIPKCVNNFTMMAQKGNSNVIDGFHYAAYHLTSLLKSTYTGKSLVKWKGRVYEYGNSLGLFRLIDLADNKLSGVIPKEIMNLSELVVLNLSTNSLQGSIPENIGHLKQLQSLDLSGNELSGGIPSSIVDLTFLCYLNLSYNNLSGKIPPGTQLETFKESAFIGNNALCGLPLSQKCPGDILRSPTTDVNGNEEDKEEFWRWFYITMGVGFAVGFWGVCSSLLLKRSWRHAYFRFVDDLMDSFYVRCVLFFAQIRRTSDASG